MEISRALPGYVTIQAHTQHRFGTYEKALDWDPPEIQVFRWHIDVIDVTGVQGRVCVAKSQLSAIKLAFPRRSIAMIWLEVEGHQRLR
jgi:hypothetical protein